VKRGIGYFVLMFVVGALAGSAVGELIGHLAPHGALYSILTRGTSIGIPHFSVDLMAFALSFGLTLRLNLCTVLGVAAAFYLRRR
jgi:hypothetical protein